ncbi:MAG: D-alanyl-D-alanine carboxypeptidase family protein [Clostridia bacterium]|nr:D-alanyl-D-alanine carboxypeptidase family protein [Clostridia bacterium]
MKTRYRGSMLLAACGLALALLSSHIQTPELPPPANERLIAQSETAAVYAGGNPPDGGNAVRFSWEELYRGLLLCVSRDHPLPRQLPAQQSRDVRSLVGLYVPAAEHVALSEETIYALCDLVRDNPLVETWIMAGMRSAMEQASLQQRAFESYRASMPVAQALIQAERDVPDSGQDEHQLATAFDVRLNGLHAWSAADPMARTKDGEWLLRNAWKYGFIRRYPPEKADVTGVENESMHWRYVGRAHAAAMALSGLCLEEYLALLHEAGALRVLGAEGAEAWILCRPCDAAGAIFDIPAGWRAEVSADNLGYAVCVLMPD